ncbi:thiamine-phosphate kinase [Alicyclobacillus tolerans]|uniref:thiamine-phosphate kinase n=1 Tax=Alicyclobacillus tolerans TaxID=90970 RepID=UPI003B7919CE
MADEFERICRLMEQLPPCGEDVRVGVGDDAAILQLPIDNDVVVSTDTMVEGVHFRQDTLSWADVGYKCVAASVSDIAAMGATPTSVLLSLALPASLSMDEMLNIYQGVADACHEYGVSVIGGDLVQSSQSMLTSTVLGKIDKKQALLRSGAKPGDVLFVTGHLGASAAGLKLLLTSYGMRDALDAAYVISRHRRPTARVLAGQTFLRYGVNSCNDISDGLASELNEIAKASQVRLRVEIEKIPLHHATRNVARQLGESALDYALSGGEDYELVATAPPVVYARLLPLLEAVRLPITAIGRVESGDGVVGEWPDGKLDVILATGYHHF